MKILFLRSDDNCKILQSVAKGKGHSVRAQNAAVDPKKMRADVRWADLIIAAGRQEPEALGALYLAYELKKAVKSLGVVYPIWVAEYWPNQSVENWVRALPTLAEQPTLFT